MKSDACCGGKVDWLLRLAVALILGQTLFFKFSGAEESKFIFESLGAEPWGRIGSGVLELIAALLVLWPGTVLYGAGLAAGLMVGALGAHLTRLGVEVKGDGGLLFTLAVVTFASSLALIWRRRRQVASLAKSVFGGSEAATGS